MTRDEAEDIKRHLDVVVVDVKSDVQQVAEGVALTNERIHRLETEVRRGFSGLGSMLEYSHGQIDTRLTRVEADGTETRARIEKVEAKLAS